ncbi:MAG: DUF3304 domain-containing protein [Burkholderiales bacterium]|nr:DUF3304 domain-containing protein [Burkholderiales bacterium]
MLKTTSSRAWLIWLGFALVLTPWLSGCHASPPAEKTVGVMLTGLDHLEAHLSIQEFSVNGVSGHQAGRGGRSVCCVSLPEVWRPDLKVDVRWAVTDWKRKVYSEHERIVPVERYDQVGMLYVHFLRDGTVKVISFNGYPEKEGYPGPSFSRNARGTSICALVRRFPKSRTP